MNELTHLDLFSGIGGFALAARAAGFRTVGFSEVEPYACRVLKRRFPGVPNIGDVRRTADFSRFRGTTVLTGGFPCQPWSSAGLKRGAGDPRHLWPAMRHVFEVVRPSWIIGENVPNLESLGGLDAALADLETLGYSAQSLNIPASAAGAWHARERVWIVAHDDSLECRLEPQPIAERDSPPIASPTRPERAVIDYDGGDRAAPRPREAEARTTEFVVAGDQRQRIKAWDAEPGLGRVVHGVPAGSHESRQIVARNSALGNSIVPQIPEQFFHWIAVIERGQTLT